MTSQAESVKLSAGTSIEKSDKANAGSSAYAAAMQQCPSAKGWPLLGNLPGLMRQGYDYFADARDAYGDIYTLNLGPSKLIVCNHPRHAQHILRDNAANYVKDGPLWTVIRELLGNGLVNSRGDFWLRQRRMMQPHFHRQRLAALTDLMVSAIDDSLSLWPTASDSLDIETIFKQLTMRVIVRTMFGLSLSTEKMEEAGEAVETAFDYMLRAMATHNLPEWVPDPRRKKCRDAIARFDAIVYEMIEHQRGRDEGDPHLLAMLIDAVDEDDGEGMNDQQLRDEVATIFLAGFETTATALAWSAYYLAESPEIFSRATAEVDTALGDRKPGFGDLRSLSYVRNVLQESMRFRPSSWFLPRVAVADDVIDSYHIPAGSDVASMTYMIHRHPEQWQEPDRFNPDRFSEEAGSQRHSFAFVPFGAGQRMCIGREFAMMEGQLALAMMLQRFKIATVPGHVPQLKLSTTLKTKDGIHVAVKPA